MDRSRYVSAILKAPMGGFLVLFIYLFFDIIASNSPGKIEVLIGSSLFMLVGIYTFYTIGLVLIIPIIWGLHRLDKFNVVTSLIAGGLFGSLVAYIVADTFKFWSYVGPIMGIASGYLLWTSWPKDTTNT